MSNRSEDLKSLDMRSRDIFREIVELFLETGEPVGSRNVSRKLQTPLSAASVRNVMTDLEQLGLIYAPHISAGRLPTEIGLRFFVDSLLEVGDLTTDERQQIEAQVQLAGKGQSVESMLTDAIQALSGLSHGAGVVLTGKVDTQLKHIEFVRLEPTRALAILVSNDGSVENRLIELPAGLPGSALVEASNYLNTHIRGKTLSEAQRDIQTTIQKQRAELDQLTQDVISRGLASWGDSDADQQQRLIVRGRANLLGDLREIDELERIRLLFDDLESKQELVQLLGLAEAGDGVRIFIGSENKLFSLSGSSLIVAPYRNSQQQVVGALGVIGPTRLNYARVIPMVDYTAKVISRLLG